jgi:predicted component of type VI protein secretion system
MTKEIIMAMEISETKTDELLEAVQRDLTQLFNDYKFKRLVKHIEATYKEQNKDVVSIDEIFYIDRFKNETFPWIEISRKIRTDIQNSESLKDKIETLEAKNRECIKKNLE